MILKDHAETYSGDADQLQLVVYDVSSLHLQESGGLQNGWEMGSSCRLRMRDKEAENRK